MLKKIGKMIINKKIKTNLLIISFLLINYPLFSQKLDTLNQSNAPMQSVQYLKTYLNSPKIDTFTQLLVKDFKTQLQNSKLKESINLSMSKMQELFHSFLNIMGSDSSQISHFSKEFNQTIINSKPSVDSFLNGHIPLISKKKAKN